MPAAGQKIKALDFSATVSAVDNTTLTNVSTTLGAGSPVVAVTFVAPTSGKVAIHLSGNGRCTGSLQATIFDIEVYLGTSASGTLIVATGSSTYRVVVVAAGSAGSTFGHNFGKTSYLSGLTAGSTYYARVMHASSNTATCDVFHRGLTIQPLVA